jgi:thioredoxin reductase (NADPH)
MSGDRIYDIAVVGAGPAGLSAAINAVIRRKDIVVLSSSDSSYRLGKAPKVENYLGMMDMSGVDMYQAFLRHVRTFGIDVNVESVTNIMPGDSMFSLLTDKGYYQSRSVVLAVGMPEKADIEGESRLLGRGVSYCATCDGPLYRGKDIAVIGYMPQAEEEVEFLCEMAKSVSFLPQYAIDQERVERLSARSVAAFRVLSGKPVSIVGEERASKLVYGRKGHEEQSVDVDGVFILRPAVPVDTLLPGLRTEDGAIWVARDMATSVRGAFAAGDCTGSPWQIAKAVGEGQIAALSAVRYLSEIAG